MTTIKQIQVTYDDELGVPFPASLLTQLEISNSDITYISNLPDSLLNLNYGAGPIYASILVKIQTEVWKYAVEKIIEGLIGLVKQEWFEEASDKAQEAEKSLLQKLPTNDYERVRQKMLSSPPNTNISDNYFPYPLMNITISENGQRWIQVLFPYPITDIQAEQAILSAQKILESVEPSSSGMMTYNVDDGNWTIKGPIKLSENI